VRHNMPRPRQCTAQWRAPRLADPRPTAVSLYQLKCEPPDAGGSGA
jgi:hypothetical protein